MRTIFYKKELSECEYEYLIYVYGDELDHMCNVNFGIDTSSGIQDVEKELKSDQFIWYERGWNEAKKKR